MTHRIDQYSKPCQVWFRLDSLPHEVLMRSINLIGRYVIPRFKQPWSVVEEPEVLRERIRASRAAAAGSSGPSAV